MKKRLQEKIDKFLAVKKKAVGDDYPEVTYKELLQLQSIFRYIVNMKWQNDYSGDEPVRFGIVDYTRELSIDVRVPHHGTQQALHDMIFDVRSITEGMHAMMLDRKDWDANAIEQELWESQEPHR